ncbi:microcystin degradation protein MlrC [Burkholderia territorii]|uniref:M81 family metallopeptidase n=1 Tax=Burkholderia territorii TaxID=1503055 RepID=UPI00075E94E9|nr:M81 family metallopeptidase [Burkholderia territorii]KVL32204.1 microcystin degradation protein MlrC [Burkholderia territorii]
MATPKTILIAGFQHETNTFAPTKASYKNFENGEGHPALPRGESLLALREINIPVGGFIRAAEEEGWSLVPVVWAGASPSAHVTADAYERISSEIIEAVSLCNFDAIYLDLHGAMVSEVSDDGEGELLSRIRNVVGRGIPIVASLDLHANVTERMLTNASGLVAFRTYPHIDMAETGKRAASLLKAIFEQTTSLTYASYRLPFLLPINSMCTLVDPARSMYRFLSGLEKGTILSLSFAAGFPAADFPECGPVVWGYGKNSATIDAVVRKLYDRMIHDEVFWKVDLLDPDKAVAEAQRLLAAVGAKGPVVIADTQDNPGAGADSNTSGMLRALVDADAQGAALGLMVDPEVASRAHEAGIGATIECTLGGKSGVAGDLPFKGQFEVIHLSDGRCRYDGPMMNGMEVDLGPVAGLRIGGVSVVVSSSKAQMLDRNLFRLGGVQPENMKILVNKSSVHFRADFQPIASAILVAKAPGPVLADPADLPWRHLAPGMRLRPDGPAFTGS